MDQKLDINLIHEWTSSIDLSDDDIRIKPHKSGKKSNRLPLIIFDVSHKSHYGVPGHISLDIFCEDIPQLEYTSIEKNYEVLGFFTKRNFDKLRGTR